MARKPRKRSRRREKKPRWMKIAAIAAGVLSAIAIAAYLWLFSYLKGPNFHALMTEIAGDATGGQAELKPFQWDGLTAKNPEVVIHTDGRLQEVRATGLRADTGLNLFRRDGWKVSELEIDQAWAKLDFSKEFTEPRLRPPSTGLAKLLPKEVNFTSGEVKKFNLQASTELGPFQLSNAPLTLNREGDRYDLIAGQGPIETPFAWLGHGSLQGAKVTLDGSEMVIDRLDLGLEAGGMAAFQGHINLKNAAGDFRLEGAISGVPCAHFLQPDWRQRFTGELASSFVVKPGPNGSAVNGKTQIRKGHLTALPILDTIAAFTGIMEFRELDFSKMEFQFHSVGDSLEITGIEAEAGDLMALRGSLTIRGEALRGVIQLGLDPKALRYLPGAEKKVFQPGADGMAWTPVVIGGTVHNVEEDLTRRLVLAAGERMFEMAGGEKVLKLGGAVLKKIPTPAPMQGIPKALKDELLGTSKDTLEAGKETLETGRDLLDSGLRGLLGD